MKSGLRVSVAMKNLTYFANPFFRFMLYKSWTYPVQRYPCPFSTGPRPRMVSPSLLHLGFAVLPARHSCRLFYDLFIQPSLWGFRVTHLSCIKEKPRHLSNRRRIRGTLSGLRDFSLWTFQIVPRAPNTASTRYIYIIPYLSILCQALFSTHGQHTHYTTPCQLKTIIALVFTI